MYKVHFEADGPERTKARLELIYTPLNEKGVRNMENNGRNKIDLMLSIIVLCVKGYWERRQMIKSSEVQKLIRNCDRITVKDKIRMLLTKCVTTITRDENRKRFLKGMPIRRIAYGVMENG